MSSRAAPRLLFVAFVSGTLAIVAAWMAQPAADGFADGLAKLFVAADVLTLSAPEEVANEWALFAAKAMALVFGGTAVLGATLELFPSVKAGGRWSWFWVLRRLGRRPAAVVGVGWVGGPLARQLRTDAKRPVYAAAIDAASPRVAAARRDGVLVEIGDASESVVRDRLALAAAGDVFVATGDDARNVEIAGDLMADRLGAGGRRVRAYVHIDDPSLRSAVRRAGLLTTPPESGLEIQVFGASELAARQLLYDDAIGLTSRAGLRPEGDEVPHLFVFGFGPLGRTAVLEAARSLHFRAGHRPRITVFGRDPAAWRAFLERHPGLAPHGLDLTSAAFFEPDDPDHWATRAGRPCDPHHRVEATTLLDEGTKHERRVRPVEYAAHAEFVTLTGDIAGVEAVAALRSRLHPKQGRAVKAAAVFCFQEERQAIEAALRLRRALHDRMGAPTDEAEPVLPLYVHLPTEEGLVVVLAPGGEPRADAPPEAAGLASRFPLRPFGKQSEVMSVAAVTGDDVERRAAGIRASHAQLRRDGARRHTDFDDSDKAAALFMPVRLDAVGIVFPSPKLLPGEAAGAGVRAAPLLEPLMAPEVLKYPRYRALEALAATRGEARIRWTDLPDAVISGGVVADDIEQRVYERIALLDRLALPLQPGLPSGCDEPPVGAFCRRQHDDWVPTLLALQLQAVARFEAEVGEAAADLAAMEHNRWMAERLVKGWRFGERSGPQRTRTTFVVNEDLTDPERAYDRIQAARVILERGPRHRLRHGDGRPPQFAYLRR